MKRLIVFLVVLAAALAVTPAYAQRYSNDRGDRRVSRYRNDSRYQHRGSFMPDAVRDWQHDGYNMTGSTFRDWSAATCDLHTRGGNWDSVAESHCAQAYGQGYRGGGYGWDRNRSIPRIKIRINLRFGKRESDDHPAPQPSNKGTVYADSDWLCNDTDHDVVISVNNVEIGILRAGQKIELKSLPSGTVTQKPRV